MVPGFAVALITV